VFLRRHERRSGGRKWTYWALVPGPEGDETLVLARSVDRREEEKAMHQRFLDRLEAALRKMQTSAESGRLKDEAIANRRLGRLMCQYCRAGGVHQVWTRGEFSRPSRYAGQRVPRTGI
jgi:hypothetical protein